MVAVLPAGADGRTAARFRPLMVGADGTCRPLQRWSPPVGYGRVGGVRCAGGC